MKPKKMYLTALLLTIIAALASYARAAAAAPEPFAIPFRPVVEDPVSAEASPETGCQLTVDDAGRYRFVLPVTEELAKLLTAGTAAGFVPTIQVPTTAILNVSGPGSAGYTAAIEIFVEHGDGTRTSLGAFSESEVAVSGTTFSRLYITNVVTQVMPGDNILVESMGRGIAGVGDCGAGNSAAIWWGIHGVEGNPDRPIMIGQALQ